jgi:glycosyltransferase involved in cell wall biosynthesis
MEFERITIIILNDLSYLYLHKLLNSIKAQRGDIEYKVIIISLVKDKATIEYLARISKEVNYRIVYSDKQHSVKHITAEVEKIKNERIILISSNVFFPNDFFEKITLYSIKEIGVLFPSISICFSGVNYYIEHKPKRLINSFLGSPQAIVTTVEILKSNPIKVGGPNIFWMWIQGLIRKGVNISFIDDGYVFYTDVGNANAFLNSYSTKNNDNFIRKLTDKAINFINKRFHHRRVDQKLILKWKEANIIDPHFFPEFVIGSFEVGICNKILNSLIEGLESDYDYVYLVPNLLKGGNTTVVRNYIKAIRRKEAKILLISTDESFSTITGDFEGCKVINASYYFKNINRTFHAELLLLLLLLLNPKRIHVINSELAYKIYSFYNKQFPETTRFYLTHYSPNVSRKGKLTGHMLEYLPYFYDRLTAISTDNKHSKELILRTFGFIMDKYHVHQQPVTRDENDKGVKQGQGLSHKIKILWASRIEYQKDLETLLEIVRHYSNREDIIFLVAGEIDNNSKEIISKLLKNKNVKYLGGFQNYKELPIQDSDLFIYTSLSDGTPNILLEVMATKGIPIFAKRIGGIPELFRNCNKLLCSDADDYIAKIDLFMEDCQAFTYEVQNYQVILKQHSWEMFYKAIENFPGYY